MRHDFRKRTDFFRVARLKEHLVRDEQGALVEKILTGEADRI
jgi:hypothetical protein